MPIQLADIYHFHLHPQHRYDTVETLYQQSAEPHIKKVGGKRSRDEFSSAEESPLSIIYDVRYVHTVRHYTTVLSDECDDFAQLCFKHRDAVFRFSMEIPDPNPASSKQMIQLVNCYAGFIAMLIIKLISLL
jgi:hypothetical protein